MWYFGCQTSNEKCVLCDQCSRPAKNEGLGPAYTKSSFWYSFIWINLWMLWWFPLFWRGIFQMPPKTIFRRFVYKFPISNGWLVVWKIFHFSRSWEFHHPNWRTHSIIFRRGRWLNHQPDWRFYRDSPARHVKVPARVDWVLFENWKPQNPSDHWLVVWNMNGLWLSRKSWEWIITPTDVHSIIFSEG